MIFKRQDHICKWYSAWHVIRFCWIETCAHFWSGATAPVQSPLESLGKLKTKKPKKPKPTKSWPTQIHPYARPRLISVILYSLYVPAFRCPCSRMFEVTELQPAGPSLTVCSSSCQYFTESGSYHANTALQATVPRMYYGRINFLKIKYNLKNWDRSTARR